MLDEFTIKISNNEIKKVVGILYEDMLNENMVNIFVYPDGVYCMSLENLIDMKTTNIDVPDFETEVEKIIKNETKNGIMEFVCPYKGISINDMFEGFNKLYKK